MKTHSLYFNLEAELSNWDWDHPIAAGVPGGAERWCRVVPGKVMEAVEDVNEAVEDQRVSLSAFTCLFNQRPRQEASPRGSAVPMATALSIVAHPLAHPFQQRGEVETFEWWRRERRAGVCVCVSFHWFEKKNQTNLRCDKVQMKHRSWARQDRRHP